MTKFILIRHCQATGQEPDASLTPLGYEQAVQLQSFLATFPIGKIVCSPFTRTIETITPYSVHENIPIEIDRRLQERILSTENMPDWFEKLQQTFKEKDVKFTGGESSIEAVNRILEVMDELKDSCEEYIALITHGNLSALLLNSIDENFGFEAWQQLTNPDVYVVDNYPYEVQFKRIWAF